MHRGSDWDTASVSSDEKDSSQATGTKKPRKKKGNTHGDDGKEGDAAKDDRDDLYQRLNSYPFTHRLLAALVDEGGGVSVSNRLYASGNVFPVKGIREKKGKWK